uniref:30S ribosomal protein S6, chloroplastic n=1 Tax=Rhodymenia pseudopalmata TaxID=31502 RepID=A0A1C9C7N4_RHOPU|nr:ribosomal protein S6 [Rhodymenia pseudopalmata]AOM64384.1 ribosomal protein S6 [Rhodymenia pseudopalmata]
MILNNYETIYILRPNTSEDTSIELINSYKFIIQSHGGQNIFVQHKGRRHLSFSIKNNYDGIYVQINYEGNGVIVKALEKAMKFNDSIIRYLTIRQNLTHANIVQI